MAGPSTPAWVTPTRCGPIRNGDGTVSLRAVANGRYVVAEGGGTGSLIANRTAVGLWEEFHIVDPDLVAVPL